MKFSNIAGQEEIKERLRRTVSDNRVSHAQLFLGPEGSGKLAMALAYAQYINCTARSPLDSCGVCHSCIKYEKLAHPDLHFIYPVATTKEVDKDPVSKKFIHHWRELVESTGGYLSVDDWYKKIGLENKQGIINTEDCNEIVRTLSYKSYESEYKVMIIWMIEKLYHAAAPKILKILEEPPDKTLFLLISEQSDLILPTILSRTQLVKFRPLNDDELVNGLKADNQLDENTAANIRYLANGNLNLARKIMESGESDQADFEFFRSWMRTLYKRDIQEIYKLTSEFHGLGREKQKKFFLYALKATRYCLMNRIENNSALRIDGEELKFIRDFTPFINPANIGLMNEGFNKAYYHIERNGSANIIFMDLSLKMTGWLRMK